MADSGCLRVSQILVNKASGDSVLQVLGNKAQKNCQIVPALPMYRGAFGKGNITPESVSKVDGRVARKMGLVCLALCRDCIGAKTVFKSQKGA